jgi:hypothetical protein
MKHFTLKPLPSWLVVALLATTPLSHAQLTSPMLGCGPVYAGFTFTVQFNGQIAKLSFNGDDHHLQFVREWQTTMGDKWVDYQSKEWVLSTSWPGEPYVAISLPNAKNSTAACDVVEVKP